MHVSGPITGNSHFSGGVESLLTKSLFIVSGASLCPVPTKAFHPVSCHLLLDLLCSSRAEPVYDTEHSILSLSASVWKLLLPQYLLLPFPSFPSSPSLHVFHLSNCLIFLDSPLMTDLSSFPHVEVVPLSFVFSVYI